MAAFELVQPQQLRRAFMPRSILLAVGVGSVLGFWSGWTTYNELLRPFAHVYVVWIAMLVALCARRPILTAAARAWMSLTAAVILFYVGQTFWYAQYYPGLTTEISIPVMAQWVVLSVVAGVVLGPICALIGSSHPWATLAASVIVGLIFADAVRWCYRFPEDAPVVTAASTLATIAVLAIAIRTKRQIGPLALGSLIFSAGGLLVVLLPDFIELILRPA